MAIDPLQASLLALTESDAQRFARYRRYWSYYTGTEYRFEEGARYIQENRLFRGLKHVFGYVAAVVDVDARFVCKTRIQVDADPEVRSAIERVWERSNFQTEKYRAVRTQCALGDAFLLLRMTPDGPAITVANSEDITLFRDPDDRATITAARQSYIFRGTDGKFHRRDWIYTAETITCYTDERVDDGYPVRHPFGDVPVVHIMCIDVGEEWGYPSWFAVQEQLDQLNELAAFARKILLGYADPILKGKGMQVAPRISRAADQLNFFALPENTDLEYLEFQGDALPRILDLIKAIDANIRDQLPELALAALRDQASLSGYAVNLKLADLIAKIEEIRGRFADGLEWINAMAAKAELGSSAPPEEFVNHVRFASILPEDTLQQLQAWQLEKAMGIASRKALLRRQGLSEEEINARLLEVRDDLNEEAGLGEAAATGLPGEVEPGADLGA